MGIKMKESKILKKIKALLLASAVILSMTPQTAIAAQEDTGQTSQSETNSIKGLTFTKIFESTDEGITPNVTFTFRMVPDDTVTADMKNGDNISVKKGIELVNGNDTVKIAYTSLSKAEQTATFSFEGVNFEGANIYRYIVYEEKPTENVNEYIVYDEQRFTVDVQVDKSGNVISITNVTNSDSTNSNNKQPIVFNNKYKYDNLVIRKKVSGSLGNKNEKFSFELYIPAPGDKIDIEENAHLKAYYEDVNTGTKTPAPDIVVGENKYQFELSDGQQLLVEHVPAGMIYTVKELGSEDYTTNITCTTVKDNNKHIVTINDSKYYDARANGSNTPIVEGENLIVFENIKEYNADTGVKIDIIPYIVLFIIAIAGVSVLIFRRKRKWAG